jgi:hypothetical protein
MELYPGKRVPTGRSRRTRHRIDWKKCDPLGTLWPSTWWAINSVHQRDITSFCWPFYKYLYIYESIPHPFSRNNNSTSSWPFRNRPLWRLRDQLKGHCGPLNRRAESVGHFFINYEIKISMPLVIWFNEPFYWPKTPSLELFAKSSWLNSMSKGWRPRARCRFGY